ncbi:integrase [Zavarzinia aquatilis]|uniref:Integrase n=2 Tax=Zavarzinia aquatilis TaxID=2211142 RepID=A0A317EG89_9PROT|nr:integrase [Zavarzinia aquatilis]
MGADTMMALTDKAIRAFQPESTPYKKADGAGLYLLVSPSGSKLWRLNYTFAGKQKTTTFGAYPTVSLADARERVREARRLLSEGIDPAAAKQQAKRATAGMGIATFEAVAREWLEREAKELDPGTHARNLSMMETHAFPVIGAMAVAEVEAPDLLRLADEIEAKGIRTARRILQKCGQVFRYAIQSGRRVTADPVPSLKGAVRRHATKNHAAVTDPDRVTDLMLMIHAYRGDPVVVALLKFMPLVFTRPGKELCRARWSEIDLHKATWTIPPERVKTRAEHTVPLSTQAVAILKGLKPVTGRNAHVFASDRSKTGHISEGTALMAIKRNGFAGEMTAHGFRAMADSLLSEQGFDPAWIDRQLAHKEPDQVKAAYRRATYMEQRRKMMQAWADYLDALVAKAEISEKAR